MNRLPLLILAMALLLLPLGGSYAGAQEAAPVPGERISFPFDPPLDQVLRYRVVKSGSGRPAVALEQALTYRRIENGYLLEVATRKVVISGHTFTPESPGLMLIGPEETISLAAPITLRLDALGRVTAVDDWDKVKDTIRAMPDRIAAELPEADRDRMRDLIARSFDPVLQVSDKGAFALVAKEWPPMLTFNSAPFEIGKNVTSQSRYFLFDGQLPVSLQHNALVERTTDGGLVLTELQHTNTDEFREAWRRFSANMPVEMAARREADLRRMSELHRNSTTHVEVDSAGVLRRGYWEVRMVNEGVIAEATRVEFERLD